MNRHVPRGAIEQHPLDADVIVEPFEVAEAGNRDRDGQVECRGAVAGQIDVRRRAQRGDGAETGIAAAAGHIRLRHIDRAGRE